MFLTLHSSPPPPPPGASSTYTPSPPNLSSILPGYPFTTPGSSLGMVTWDLGCKTITCGYSDDLEAELLPIQSLGFGNRTSTCHSVTRIWKQNYYLFSHSDLEAELVPVVQSLGFGSRLITCSVTRMQNYYLFTHSDWRAG